MTVDSVNEAPVDATDEHLERVRFEGITLIYPTNVFDSVALTADPGANHAVRLSFPALGDDVAGELSIVNARDVNGTIDIRLDDADRVRLDSLEELLSGPTDEEIAGDRLLFVNGEGLRSVNSDMYIFDGVTKDGRFLIRFDTKVGGSTIDEDEMVRLLDQMVVSVFVDGAAEVLNGEECGDQVELVSDRGVDDGTTVGPGVELTKTWRIRNSGDCVWSPGYSWVFTGGDPVTVLRISDFESVEPGEEFEVSVTFQTPSNAGTYAAQWQLQSPGQFQAVGPAAYVLFEVVES